MYVLYGAVKNGVLCVQKKYSISQNMASHMTIYYAKQISYILY